MAPALSAAARPRHDDPRLDYDTFINVSFFLQGRADQFAQQKPGRRKEILGSILGLEVWEAYKERAAGRRKELESELKKLEGHVAEIDAELSEEDARKQRLLDLETQLKELGSLRKAQEIARETSRQLQTGLERQRQQVKTLSRDLERSQADLDGSKSRLAGREQERLKSTAVAARAAEIEAAHADWQRTRQELDKWDGLAVQFHEMENRRRPFLDEINTEKARLEQERTILQQQNEDLTAQAITVSGLQGELSTARKELDKAEVRLKERPELETRLKEDRSQQAELLAANASLKREMTCSTSVLKTPGGGRRRRLCAGSRSAHSTARPPWSRPRPRAPQKGIPGGATRLRLMNLPLVSPGWRRSLRGFQRKIPPASRFPTRLPNSTSDCKALPARRRNGKRVGRSACRK
jgi:DNA repair exonuclease SbcCD ATPase subunit